MCIILIAYLDLLRYSLKKRGAYVWHRKTNQILLLTWVRRRKIAILAGKNENLKIKIVAKSTTLRVKTPTVDSSKFGSTFQPLKKVRGCFIILL